ncbi:carbohydrate porin [Dolichospermum sp. LEGE 00240]|uniref:iron uptake porin n=1 Tax=Dolichospermum sp. LEGE 00240 TaxID=1828603 RepID=UPI00187F48A4|nr:carbohydrate porin [Dolichospermum sp. LEGE 00240]
MNKIFRQMLVAYLTICTTGILLQMQALAEEQSPTLATNQSSQTTTDSTEMSQVTSVSQLSDVQPNDWGFNALQSLVERYGCIKGYPNQTFRGNRATTRFEFASGLNTCLNQINELITQGTGDLVRKEDLATIERLKEEFGNELAQVRGRLDNLESRIGDVEANQFSTTAKLSGQVVSYVGDILGKGDGSTNNTILGYRAIVGVDTSSLSRTN